MPTGRRFWNDLSVSEKIQIHAKMLFWIPVGTVMAACLGYLYMTTSDYKSGKRAAFTHEEAIEFISTDLWFMILMSFVASLAGNVTSLKQVIKSKTVKKHRWNT